MKIYARGARWDDPDRAVVSLFDRGYLLGDGIFETIRVRSGAPVRLAEHLDRLWIGVEATGLVPAEDRATVAALAGELAAGWTGEAALRITITRGVGPRGLATDGLGPAALTMIAQPFSPWPRAVEVAWVAARRIPPACLDNRFKTTSALAAVLARRSIALREGLQRSLDGQLASGLASSVLLVENGRLSTPHLESGCLPGVTRAALLRAAPSLGLLPLQRRIEPEELDRASEIVLSSALMGVVRVAAIDGRAMPDAGWAARLEAAIA